MPINSVRAACFKPIDDFITAFESYRGAIIEYGQGNDEAKDTLVKLTGIDPTSPLDEVHIGNAFDAKYAQTIAQIGVDADFQAGQVATGIKERLSIFGAPAQGNFDAQVAHYTALGGALTTTHGNLESSLDALTVAFMADFSDLVNNNNYETIKTSVSDAGSIVEKLSYFRERFEDATRVDSHGVPMNEPLFYNTIPAAIDYSTTVVVYLGKEKEVKKEVDFFADLGVSDETKADIEAIARIEL